METPDKWVVVKIIDDGDILYKVFASWYGGYLGSDSWRINSGITKVNMYEDDYIDFIGYSGSCYRCVIGHYGTSTYSQGVLNNILKMAEKAKVIIEVLPENTDWSNLLY